MDADDRWPKHSPHEYDGISAYGCSLKMSAPFTSSEEFKSFGQPVVKNKFTTGTVEYDPFIKSHLALRNSLEGLMACNVGHVTFQKQGTAKPSSSTVRYFKTTVLLGSSKA